MHICVTAISHHPLHWRHNDHDGVSNHQSHGCLLNRLFRRRSKKSSKLRVTGLGVGNSPGPVNYPHKGPVTRKIIPFDDVIMVVLGNSIPNRCQNIICISVTSFQTLGNHINGNLNQITKFKYQEYECWNVYKYAIFLIPQFDSYKREHRTDILTVCNLLSFRHGRRNSSPEYSPTCQGKKKVLITSLQSALPTATAPLFTKTKRCLNIRLHEDAKLQFMRSNTSSSFVIGEAYRCYCSRCVSLIWNQ